MMTYGKKISSGESRPRETTDEIIAALERCPALSRLSRDSLLPLAEAVELRVYDVGHVFYANEDSVDGPLRVLVYGRVYWSSEPYPQPKGSWVLAPGTVFGLNSVNKWVDREDPRRWVGAAPPVTAAAQSKVWLLELARDAFDKVLGDPASAALVRALLKLFPVSIHAPMIVRAMRGTSQFSRLASPRLYWLLQYAIAHCPSDYGVGAAWNPAAKSPGPVDPQQQKALQDQPPVDIIDDGEVDEDAMTCLQYVLLGSITASLGGEAPVTLRPGDMIGVSELFSEKAVSKGLVAVARGTWVVSLSNCALRSALCAAPAMAMMLGPAHPTGAECPNGDAPSYPLLSEAVVTMVLADQAVDRTTFSLEAAVAGASQAMRDDFGERVWTLHIVPQPAPVTAPTPGLVSPPRTIEVPPAVDVELYVRAQLDDFAARYGLFFDQILVEASAFDPSGTENGALWRAMIGVRGPSRVDYIVDDPAQWNLIPDWFVGLSMALGVEVQPLALLEPLGDLGPLYQIVEDIKAVLTGASSLPVMLATMPQQLRDLIERFIVVVTQVYGSAYFIPEAWPLDAVRLRLPTDPATASTDEIVAATASYSRWARAATSRRVGLAVGGAGALSFVALPFIRELMANKVPIDILSGASAGTFIGAFFSAMGERGLSRLEFGWPALEIGTLLAFFDNIPITWWLTWASEYTDLSQIDLPVVSVATYAGTGDVHQQTAGLAGKGMIASGSIPPLVSTFIGNDRFLDGGLSNDVPTAVLDAVGANLSLGVQPISKVTPYPEIPEIIPIPYWKKWLITLNPVIRLADSVRGYLMIFRQAAYSEDQYADVFYVATTRFASAGFWWQVPRIINMAQDSASLQHAVTRTVALWQRLAGPAPGRLRVDPVTGAVELGTALSLQAALVGLSFTLVGYSTRILARLGEGVAPFASLELDITVTWAGSSLPSPSLQAAAEQVIIAAIEQGAPGLPAVQRVISHAYDPSLTHPELFAAYRLI